MQPFKNLIFDLGDVIIDIDYQVTVGKFQQLAVVDFSQIVSYSAQKPIFDLFERGEISPAQFRNELRQFLKPEVTDEQINDAWNAILVYYPPAKIDLLQELKTRYNTFALSNINEMHVHTINEAARTKFGAADFGSFFHKAYYSNEVGHRKPEKAIYEFILQKEAMVPAETFFVDDKQENILAARALGIQAYQLKDRNKLEELLTSLNII